MRQLLSRTCSLAEIISGDLHHIISSEMAVWPAHRLPLQHSAPVGSLRSFSSLTSQHWAQQRIERLLSASFASGSRPTEARHSPPQQASQEQASSGRRRFEGKKASGLRSVAGIGPRNEQRLVSKGIDTVDSLADVFNEQNNRDEEKMVSFLQVGCSHFPGKSSPAKGRLCSDAAVLCWA